MPQHHPQPATADELKRDLIALGWSEQAAAELAEIHLRLHGGAQ